LTVHIRAYPPQGKQYEPPGPFTECVVGGNGDSIVQGMGKQWGSVDITRFNLEDRVVRKTYFRHTMNIQDVWVYYLVEDDFGTPYPHHQIYKTLSEAYTFAEKLWSHHSSDALCSVTTRMRHIELTVTQPWTQAVGKSYVRVKEIEVPV